MKPIRILTLFSLILLPIISPAQIVTNRWTGGSDADWFNPNNWSLTQIPQAGQAVVLDDGFVTAYTNILLTQSTPALASLEITNRLLTFSNWSTFLSATTITLRSSATLTLPAAFPNGAMSNRIYLICSNFTMETGSRIDADGRGFAGYYQGAQGTGNGPGGGSISSGWGAGGGHGGRGGYPQSTTATRGAINGSVLDPNTGSGGGGGTQYGVGGHGGGLVRIDATGTLTLNGLITANGGGAAGYPSGGGSGGGVRLECWRVDSTSTGIIQAIGGNGGTPGDARGGRGGGGRIVIQYNPLAQQTLGPPAIRLAAYGAATGAAYAAEAGTLFISDQQFLVPPIPGTNAQIYGVTNWTLSSLTFTGYSWILNGPSVHVQITNTLMVGTNGFLSLHLGNTRLDCSTIILTNGGRLSLHSGPTNAATPAYGALVSVTNEIWVGANSWLYPYSDPTNGGSLLFRVKDVILSATNGGIDATGAGFAALKGYGAGATDVSQYGGGGGYGGKGGKGGNTNPSGGAPYGPTNPPIHPGSGAGGAYLGIATGRVAAGLALKP